MANIWHAYASRVTFATNKAMIDIFNGISATRVLRILRIFHYNITAVGTAGAFGTMELRRIIEASGGAGTLATLMPRDPSDRELESAVSVGAGRTIVQADAPNLFRRYLWSIDDPTTTQAAAHNTYELAIPFFIVWDAGYHDSNIQPLVARAGQGYALLSTTAGVSFNSFGIDFTDEDS